MQLRVTRLEGNRYETLIRRRDRVSFHVKGVAHMFAIPHDLAHFLVESVLRLDRGFWGSVADGAIFKSMSYVGGRRKPKAAERSQTVLKANAAGLTEAEILVRLFNDTIEQGHGEKSPRLRALLRGRWAPPGKPRRQFGEAEIAAVFAAYQDVLARWRELPVGSTLEFVWKT